MRFRINKSSNLNKEESSNLNKENKAFGVLCCLHLGLPIKIKLNVCAVFIAYFTLILFRFHINMSELLYFIPEEILMETFSYVLIYRSTELRACIVVYAHTGRKTRLTDGGCSLYLLEHLLLLLSLYLLFMSYEI